MARADKQCGPEFETIYEGGPDRGVFRNPPKRANGRTYYSVFPSGAWVTFEELQRCQRTKVCVGCEESTPALWKDHRWKKSAAEDLADPRLALARQGQYVAMMHCRTPLTVRFHETESPEVAA